MLGPVAAQIQSAALVKDEREGAVETSCTYGLAPYPAGQEPDPGNALTITRTIYPDRATLSKIPLPRLMMTPLPVQGPWEKGWFTTTQLATRAECILETVNGQIITRITLAVPGNTKPVDQVKEKLATLITGQ
ncbi:hypothetical protein [Arthrobacter sp. GAS37]|uniref:hypothetical protein n=1 Tax=Arthrobacter sp. GAS37 TaxID=3156261 RepID=UPI0038511C88